MPDHYLTEYPHPAAQRRREVVADLERFRGMGARDVLARALLLGGFAFGSDDLSGAATSAGADLDPAGPVVALATPPVLGRADPAAARGTSSRPAAGCFCNGLLPTLDEDGTACTVLADALGLAAGDRVEGTPHHFPSVRSTDWAGPQPEVRVGVLQHLEATGSTTVEPLVRDVAADAPVGVHVSLAGGGRAIVLACDYPCHLGFWQSLLGRLGVTRHLVTEGSTPGLVASTTTDRDGQRLLHLVNVAPVGAGVHRRRRREPPRRRGGDPAAGAQRADAADRRTAGRGGAAVVDRGARRRRRRRRPCC